MAATVTRFLVVAASWAWFVSRAPATPPVICGNGVIEADEQCDDGNSAGGDGCAANCTHESLRQVLLRAGTCQGGAAAGRACKTDRDCPSGACAGERSSAQVQSRDFLLVLPLDGSLTLRTGSARATAALPAGDDRIIPAGDVPAVILERDVFLERIALPPFGCICVRLLADAPPRAAPPVPGVAARGSFSCAAQPAAPVDYHLIADHDISDIDPQCSTGVLDPFGACTLVPPRPQLAGSGPRGSAILDVNLSITTMLDGGTCCRSGDAGCPVDPLKGGDGIPCTADDGVTPPTLALATTGAAEATIFDADRTTERIARGSGEECRAGGDCGAAQERCLDTGLGLPCSPSSRGCECRVACNARECLTRAQGRPVDCDALLANANARVESGTFALASVLLNSPIGDVVITSILRPVPPSCAGDCDGSGATTVDEIIISVNIGLGLAPLSACGIADTNADSQLSVDEIIAAVNAALAGCG